MNEKLEICKKCGYPINPTNGLQDNFEWCTCNPPNWLDADIIPPCKGYFIDTMDGRDFDCEYISSVDFDCDSCICVTSKYGDFSGIDPRTGKKFNMTAIECLEKHGVNCAAIELDAEYSFKNILNAMEEYAERQKPPNDRTAKLYDELLMAVERKFPNESRHETALRYIHEAEIDNMQNEGEI